MSSATKNSPRTPPPATVKVWPVIACKMLEAPCWNKVTDLLVYFSDDTLQIRFVAFAMTAKETHFARLKNAGNVIAALEQETTARVN